MLAMLTAWGLPGVFLVALAAGSVVPVPSEAVAAAVALGTGRPLATWCIATGANATGALTLWALGRWVVNGGGGPVGRWVERRRERDPQRFALAQVRLRRFGAPVLLMSWLPIAGDAFVFAAGFSGVHVLPFLVFTAAGKGLRYGAVILGALGAARALSG